MVVLVGLAFDFEQLAIQVVGRANARSAKAHGFGFGGVHILGQRLVRRLGPHQQQHGRFDQHAHVGEVVDRIKGHGAACGRGIDVDRSVADQQGVAIGGLARREFGADQTASACAVVHHHGLRQSAREVRRHHARHGVHQATGWVLADQTDRAFAGPGRRLGVDPRGSQCGGTRSQ